MTRQELAIQPEQTLVPFNENLLERARTQWQFGDWQSLEQLSRETLQHHPDRAKLALLAAAGRLQTGQSAEAKAYICLAQNWGVSKKLIGQILIAGVHNSIGCAAAIGNQQQRALQHFESAIATGTPESDANLMRKARLDYQLRLLGVNPNFQSESNKIESRLREVESTINALQQEKINLESQRKSKYYTPSGYEAKRYWTNRHAKYQFNLQGVGNKGLTDEENQMMYAEAASVFIRLCRDLEVNFHQISVLDVGCGNGFYSNLLNEQGVVSYCGIDIADTLLDDLRHKHPSYIFKQMDVTGEYIAGKYDLIIMIDVTQHITIQDKFSFAMQNIKRSLKNDGVFVVTSWLKAGLKNSFYERSRDIQDYRKEFDGWEFSEPLSFRDKFIFAIRKRGY